MAPEVLQGFTAPGVKLEGYDGFKADVWSVGAMTFGMLAGTKAPWSAKDENTLYSAVTTKNWDSMFPADLAELEEDLLDFLGALLQIDYRVRASTQAMCRHPYIRNRAGGMQACDQEWELVDNWFKTSTEAGSSSNPSSDTAAAAAAEAGSATNPRGSPPRDNAGASPPHVGEASRQLGLACRGPDAGAAPPSSQAATEASKGPLPLSTRGTPTAAGRSPEGGRAINPTTEQSAERHRRQVP